MFQLSIFIRLIWSPESRTLLLWVQLGTTPQTCLSTGCPTSSQSTLALRRASFSVVTPRAGFLDHHSKCQQNYLFQCSGSSWRKSQRNHSWCTSHLTTSRSLQSPFWMSKCINCSHLSMLTWSPSLSLLLLTVTMSWMFLTDIPGPVASGRKMEGSVSLPGGYWLPRWWCLKDETAVSLSSLALNLALTSLVDLLMISHRLATKIDLEVRHVRNEVLSYPASSTFEPFVNNVDSNDDENDENVFSGWWNSKDLSGDVDRPWRCCWENCQSSKEVTFPSKSHVNNNILIIVWLGMSRTI